MNAQLEQEVQDKYCQLWLSHKQALIGKYFQKENLAGKGADACLYELLVCKYGNLDVQGVLRSNPQLDSWGWSPEGVRQH